MSSKLTTQQTYVFSEHPHSPNAAEKQVRSVRDRVVGGSNPLAPTNTSPSLARDLADANGARLGQRASTERLIPSLVPAPATRVVSLGYFAKLGRVAKESVKRRASSAPRTRA